MGTIYKNGIKYGGGLPTPESKDKLLMSTENEETSELEWSQVDKSTVGDSPFIGTEEEWEALSLEEKAKYKIVNFLGDDGSGVIDDEKISTYSTWSSQKINDSLVDLGYTTHKSTFEECIPSGDKNIESFVVYYGEDTDNRPSNAIQHWKVTTEKVHERENIFYIQTATGFADVGAGNINELYIRTVVGCGAGTKKGTTEWVCKPSIAKGQELATMDKVESLLTKNTHFVATTDANGNAIIPTDIVSARTGTVVTAYISGKFCFIMADSANDRYIVRVKNNDENMTNYTNSNVDIYITYTK